MPRKRIIRCPRSIYHLTSRCNNQSWFDIPLVLVWDIFKERLNSLGERYDVQLHLLCLMSNHFHLLASFPKENLDLFMRDFMTSVSKAVARTSGRINHVFGGRYRWSILRNSWEAAYVYKYICRNPVRAGMVNAVEDYRFCTYNETARSKTCFRSVERIDSIWDQLKLPLEKRTAWLNIPTPKEAEELIGRGLRRFEFQLPKTLNEKKWLKELVNNYGVETPMDAIF